MSAPDRDPEVPGAAGAPTAQVPSEPPRSADSTALPPVVIVVVAHNPGWWFDDTLRSIGEQDYANASVLVIDAASDTDLQDRIAAVLPDARLRRLESNNGFGASCNEVLATVQGAAFYLFCHDDVRLAPDTVQTLVEEAFRSNAGIVGPKIVDWHEPQRLLQVGMGADKTGYPSPYIERGELDQGQHDGVRDAFYIPGAATLVRTDLFEALGGFDPGISFHADDLDLCWRARAAGGRVVVAPSTAVGHLEALGVRHPVDDRRRLQMRHRQRAMRVASSFWTRVRVVPQAALLALAEIVYALVLGRFRQARDVAGAWTWNLSHRGQTRTRRKALSKIRTVPDRDIRALQAKGSARFAAFLRGQLGASGDRLASVAGARRELADTLRSSSAGAALTVWLVVTAVIVFGSRDLLFGDISAVGDLPLFGDSATDLIRQWTSGWRDVGLGAVDANPTGLGFIGLLGYPLLGAMGVLRTLLILGMLPLGIVGMWRLCKPIGSRRARVVGLVVYAASPIAYNSLADGQWGGLVLYGLAPWIVSQLAKASGLSPFGPVGGESGPGVRARPLVQRLVMVGVLSAIAAMLFPVALVVVVGMALALALGGLVAGQLAGSGRVLLVAVGGALVGMVLHLPWSASWLSGGWDAIAGTTSAGSDPLDLGAILRFETGPVGAGPLGYALLVVALLPLFIGRDWRLGWAVRAWGLALAGLAGVWVAAQGWLPGDLPSAELLLAPAAVGLALAAAMGMAAFEVDLPDYHFGWRQIVSLLAGAALVLAVFPVIGAAIDGRWHQPAGDYDSTLAFLDEEGQAAPFRVLWLGDASVLPLAGWQLDAPEIDDLGPGATLAYATSDNGTPSLADRWAGDPSAATTGLGDALEVAASGGTSRLGSLLAPMGVRYIVVPLAIAPEPYSEPAYDAAGIEAMLEGQLDLSSVTAAGVVVYENASWGPTRALLPPDTAIPPGGDSLLEQVFPAVSGAPVALPDDDGYQRFQGELPPSVVYLAAASADEWRLRAGDGTSAERVDALGWANAFLSDGSDDATLWFETPTSRLLILAGQVLLWILAIIYLLRVRVVSDERRTL